MSSLNLKNERFKQLRERNFFTIKFAWKKFKPAVKQSEFFHVKKLPDCIKQK